MSFVVSNCNYCRTKNIRLDNKGFNRINPYQWDILAICSNCNSPTVYRLSQNANVDYPISEQLKNTKKLEDIRGLNLSLYFSIGSTVVPPKGEIVPCPSYVPLKIQTVFDEATLCFANSCYTASGAMFRLCLDITTKELLKEWLESNTDSNNHPNSAQKDKLFNRIEFLIDKCVIPSDLKEYAHHIRLDGNEAAHEGSTEKQDAEDLLDFTELFLERIYTMKKQLELAQERRLARRTK